MDKKDNICQAWELSKSDYLKADTIQINGKIARLKVKSLPSGGTTLAFEISGQEWYARNEGDHKYLIKRAIAEGKNVPAEVLADYPDLKGNICTACEGEGEVYTGSSIPGDEGFNTCLVCDGNKTQPTNEEIIELRKALSENYYDAKGLREAVVPELEERIRFLTNIITVAPHSPDCQLVSEGKCTCWKNNVREMATPTRDTSVCPGCGSSDITGMEVVIDDSQATQEAYCNECEAEWSDIYDHSKTIAGGQHAHF